MAKYFIALLALAAIYAAEGKFHVSSSCACTRMRMSLHAYVYMCAHVLVNQHVYPSECGVCAMCSANSVLVCLSVLWSCCSNGQL